MSETSHKKNEISKKKKRGGGGGLDILAKTSLLTQIFGFQLQKLEPYT